MGVIEGGVGAGGFSAIDIADESIIMINSQGQIPQFGGVIDVEISADIKSGVVVAHVVQPCVHVLSISIPKTPSAELPVRIIKIQLCPLPVRRRGGSAFPVAPVLIGAYQFSGDAFLW